MQEAHWRLIVTKIVIKNLISLSQIMYLFEIKQYLKSQFQLYRKHTEVWN
jgi:hypothetical protein